MLKNSDLGALLNAQAQPAVSVYLPLHPTNREIRQDSVRLRNLLQRAHGELLDQGLDAPMADALLKPAIDLIDDTGFWRDQDQGLALFIAPGEFHAHRLPVEPPEETVVGHQFHIRHLLPLLAEDGEFYILSITSEKARLFKASQFGIEEDTGIDMPLGTSEVAQETDYEQHIHGNPVARPRGPGGPTGVFHNQSLGEDPQKTRETEWHTYLKRVAKTVEEHLGDTKAPVVLAGDAQNHGNFRTIAKLKTLVDEALELNPEAFSADELREKALELVKPYFTADRDQALDRFNALLGNGEERAALKVEEIVKAARFARVETLFAARGQHLWGHFDEEKDLVVAHGHNTPEDDDLLDIAATDTLRNGGRVFLLTPEEMPRGALLAAILRY